MVRDAKTEVFCNFVRIVSFNRLQCADLTRAVLLSLIPAEYHLQWLEFDFDTVKQMSGAIKNLLAFFKEYFADYFDSTGEGQLKLGQVSLSLPHKLLLSKRQPLLSDVEVQMLFVAFLSLHKHLVVRTNFVIDVAVTKRRQTDVDHYDYKKSR